MTSTPARCWPTRWSRRVTWWRPRRTAPARSVTCAALLALSCQKTVITGSGAVVVVVTDPLGEGRLHRRRRRAEVGRHRRADDAREARRAPRVRHRQRAGPRGGHHRRRPRLFG